MFFNITCVLAAVATLASFWLCWRHFQHYFQPQFQRWIVRIVLMVPVYSVASCLSFRFFWYTPYIDVVRDSYEAFVLYSFHTLLLHYLGPDLDAQHARMAGKAVKRYPAPFCCWWYNPAGYAFLLNTRYLVLQYVVVRPFTTVLAMILTIFGALCPNSSSPAHGQFWVTYTNLVSSTAAVYGLFTLYLVISHDIKEHHPLWKMLAVKFIVFFTFWQGLVLSGLISVGVIKPTKYYDSESTADMISAFLVCAEMLIAAALHVKAFPHSEFVDPLNRSLRTRVGPAILDSLSPMHILRDIASAPKEVRTHRKRRKARRAKRQLNGVVGDIFDSDSISMVDVDIDGKRRSSHGSSMKSPSRSPGRKWSAASTPLKSVPAVDDAFEEQSEDGSEDSGDSGDSYEQRLEAGRGLEGGRFTSSDPLKPEDIDL
ncbi:organic solute transporter Ostalpha-domain-containing protein [Powellomyces hirtus]|nr:organic solute transporter Ostalpha-domain-containing protein [Powellomyces hirtus]